MDYKRLIILVGKNGQPSMEKVFQKMARPNTCLVIKSHKKNCFIEYYDFSDMTKKNTIYNPKYNAKNTILVRWGNFIPVITDKKTITYNLASILNKISDKGKTRLLLSEKGVATPKTQLQDILDNCVLNFPIIARPSHHQQGKNLWVCHNIDDINNSITLGATYFSELYPKTEEYRVHCGSGKVLGCLRKPTPDDKNIVAWNRHQNHQSFKIIKQDDWEDFIIRLALLTLDNLNLCFGSVDIMVQRTLENLPKAVVCEVNTAATLVSSPFICDRWTKYFNWLGNSNQRRDNWDYTKFKKTKSLSWKLNQLNQ